MRLLIAGGRVVDPYQGLDEPADVVVDGEEIEAVLPGGRLAAEFAGRGEGGRFDRVIDASGLIVAPGLVDIHVHLREPGFEHKEDIGSGCAAAAAGGFTAVCCMPNTSPAIDTPQTVEYVRRRAREVGLCDVFPIAAISKGQAGKELTEMGELKDAGAVAVSDDGRWVEDPELMRCALQYARQFDLPVISHAEEPRLSAGGVMHLGRVSTRVGLRGIPAAAEEVAVARDIILAEATGARLHLAHLSTAGSVELVRQAKRRGVPVTAEVTPHHFSLTDEAVAESGYDTNTKMSPPLRGQKDVEALIEGLADGTIDAIATDHAPHAADEKEVEYDYAPNGIVGLETALGLTITRLVRPGRLTLMCALERLSRGPAAALSLPRRGLRRGAPANIIVFDMMHEYAVDVNAFRSRGRNSPFHGQRLRGRAVCTVYRGRVVHEVHEAATAERIGSLR